MQPQAPQPVQAQPQQQQPGSQKIPVDQIKAFLRRAGLPDDIEGLPPPQVYERMALATQIMKRQAQPNATQ
jgi:hypothetical protein